MQFIFEIPGDPMAWKRVRVNHFSRAFYEDDEQSDYKAKVALFAKTAGVTLSYGEVWLALDFYMRRPKRISKKQPGAVQCPTKPDGDNLWKMVGDALNGIAWKDDAQIVNCQVRKWYHAINDAPRTKIQINS